MTRSLKSRVKKLEKHMGKDRGWPIIIVQPGETKEQAIERDLAQHPEHKDCPGHIIFTTSRSVPPQEPPAGKPGGGT